MIAAGVGRHLDGLTPLLRLRGVDGPLAQPVAYAMENFGKLARPAMVLAAADAVGGNAIAVLPAAAALERCHTASLVHDDIIDADPLRRGRASVHSAFGSEAALITGDTLLFASFEWPAACLERGIPAERIVRAVSALASAGVSLCAGQTSESALSLDGGLAPYEAMARGKTSSLFIGALQVGAILGGASAAEHQALTVFGAEFGIAFQMQDDLLPYLGGGGKDPDSDIRNGRITAALLTAFAAASEEERDLLVRAQKSAAAGEAVDVAAVRRLLGAPENVAAAQRAAQSHVRAAREALDQFHGTSGGATLSAILEESVCRNH